MTAITKSPVVQILGEEQAGGGAFLASSIPIPKGAAFARDSGELAGPAAHLCDPEDDFQATPAERMLGFEGDLDELAGRLRRRVALLHRAGLFDRHRLRFRVKRLTTVSALREAYALVRSVYVEKGYLPETSKLCRVRPFEAMPEMVTLAAQVDGQIVAVASLIPDSKLLGLPSDLPFGKELGRLRAQGRKVCEITNLAIMPEYRNSPIFLELTQACFAHACAMGCDDMFIAISPGHVPFFGEILRFDSLGEPRTYSEKIEDIVQPMRLRIHDVVPMAQIMDRLLGSRDAFLLDFYCTGNPFRDRVAEWEYLNVEFFGDPEMLRELVADLECTREEMRAIRRRWGTKLFRSVFGKPGARRATMPQHHGVQRVA